MTIYIIYVNLTSLSFFKYNDNQIRKRLIIIYSQAMRAICIIFLFSYLLRKDHYKY
jgi:hypothetical protein